MNASTDISKKSLVIIISLIALAVGWRLLNHQYGFAYNLELVTAVSILAVLRFGWKAGLVVPLTTMAISDAAIGNTNILLFTWGSFAIIGLGAVALRRLNHRPSLQIASSAAFAILSSGLFFLVTNMGVWLQGYYPPTVDGLMMSLAMGVPFYKNMLLGNLVLIPVAVAAWQYSRVYVEARRKLASS